MSSFGIIKILMCGEKRLRIVTNASEGISVLEHSVALHNQGGVAREGWKVETQNNFALGLCHNFRPLLR